jgi:hypothetical protein
MAKPITVTISRRALIGRINRALAAKRRQVRADRYGGVTKHLIIDVKEQTVVEADVNLQILARKLGVLKPWERAAP